VPIEQEMPVADAIREIAQVNQAGTAMRLLQVTVWLLSCFNAGQKIGLVLLVRDMSIVKGRDLAAFFHDLPASPMPPQIHHALGSVDFSASGVLCPCGKLIALTTVCSLCKNVIFLLRAQRV